MKELFRVALVACLLMTLLLVPGVASAAPPDGAEGPRQGGCPTGGSWEKVEFTPGHLSSTFNFNGDEFVCVFWVPAFDGESLPAFMDNVIVR